jgi:hypothetical protein
MAVDGTMGKRRGRKTWNTWCVMDDMRKLGLKDSQDQARWRSLNFGNRIILHR